MKKILIEKNNDNREIIKMFSPGRINLIGEHVDYEGGSVMPAAIELGITAYASKSNEININSLSVNNKWINFPVRFDYKYKKNVGFQSFVEGVYNIVGEYNEEFKMKIQGLNIVMNSTIPMSSGLSSSAAFGVLILETLNELYDLKLSSIEIATLFKKVENNYMGLKSGIMDQYAIANGKRNNFLLLNTSTLECKYIPSHIAGHKFLIINTMKPRKLVESKYNERVDELIRAKKLLADVGTKISEISELKNDFNKVSLISEEIPRKRTMHVLEENIRVNKMVHALKSGDVVLMGKLLNESHDSLKNLYQVSCAELDFIQNWIIKNVYVKGARMMGAGFGGCVLALASNDIDLNDFNTLNQIYKEKFGHAFEILETGVGDGTRKLED